MNLSNHINHMVCFLDTAIPESIREREREKGERVCVCVCERERKRVFKNSLFLFYFILKKMLSIGSDTGAEF